MSTNKPYTTKEIRTSERRDRAANDPWFGKRRRAGEVGRTKTRAEASRKACRKSTDWS